MAVIHLISESCNNLIPVLVMPWPAPLPFLPYDPLPLQGPILARSLPAETAYGPVQSGLALVCAREHPWVQLAWGKISVITWGSYSAIGSEFLADIPPDHLVFLAILTQIVALEPWLCGLGLCCFYLLLSLFPGVTEYGRRDSAKIVTSHACL
ncbi:hypothetical protein B0H10DRAFT_1958726 [Mycena sp. CBHHK59/15]|nr:hypothetical protein B0H10DRAFT_1958726 [Mycena sp. CBHHK59/15]